MNEYARIPANVMSTDIQSILNFIIINAKRRRYRTLKAQGAAAPIFYLTAHMRRLTRLRLLYAKPVTYAENSFKVGYAELS